MTGTAQYQRKLRGAPSCAPRPVYNPAHVFETIPNVSDGRHADVLTAIADGVRAVPGLLLLDQSADPSHNRAVFTMAGDAEAVFAALMHLFDVATRHIDLRTHTGVHPRVGAVDVVPIVPLGDTTLEACIALSQRVAQTAAERFALPIYLYEASATHAWRTRLEQIRKGQFEGLHEKMRQPEWVPDYGPTSPHPTAGATVVGARRPLIAFNINLASHNVDAAKAIARQVRESSGGLPCVKALGLSLDHRGVAQVSMNLTDYTRTSVRTVFEAVTREARARGEQVLESELIGLIPEAALADVSPEQLKLTGFSRSQILEVRIAECAARS